MERQYVTRGLLAGAAAGLLAFVFARIFAEPVIGRAIDYENARDAAQAALDRVAGAPVPAAAPELFSRTVQADVGIAVALVVFGAGLGALLAVVFTLTARGTFRGVRPRALAGLLALGGFVSVYLVPFLKYPANPPSIGHADTIRSRGALGLLLTAISVVALVAAVQLGVVLARRRGAWDAWLLSALAYAVVMGVAFLLLPALGHLPDNVQEYGRHATETPLPLRDPSGTIVFPGFPADDLFSFRLFSVGTQLVLWATTGLLYGPLVERVGRVRRPRETTLA